MIGIAARQRRCLSRPGLHRCFRTGGERSCRFRKAVLPIARGNAAKYRSVLFRPQRSDALLNELALGSDDYIGRQGAYAVLPGSRGEVVGIEFDGDITAFDGGGDIRSRENIAFHSSTWLARWRPEVKQHQPIRLAGDPFGRIQCRLPLDGLLAAGHGSEEAAYCCRAQQPGFRPHIGAPNRQRRIPKSGSRYRCPFLIGKVSERNGVKINGRRKIGRFFPWERSSAFFRLAK